MKKVKIYFKLLGLLSLLIFASCKDTDQGEILADQSIQIEANNIDDELSRSAEYCEDCVKEYFFPRAVLAEGADVSAFVESLSESELEGYLVDKNDTEAVYRYCGGWILDSCGRSSSCSAQTGGSLPVRKRIHRNCHWGVQYSSYCWFRC